MSTINSNADDLVLNADGSTKTIKLQIDGVEKAVIDSSGNVGIGVTPESSYTDRPVLRIGSGLGLMCRASGNPSHTWINSNCYQDPSTADDKYIGTDEASQISQTNGAFNFKVAPSGTADTAISFTTALIIDNSGGISWGSSTATTGRMVGKNYGHSSLELRRYADAGAVAVFYDDSTQSGSISVSGSSTSYNTSSDYRLKENVVPMTGSIDRLKALNPSRFNFIADADTTVDGFLAHEVWH